MSILQQLETQLKEAMKARNTELLAAIRLIKSTVKNKEIELIRPLTEAEFFQVLGTMVKQRKDSMDQFKAAGRDDLYQKEESELKVIESFLPKSLSDEELSQMIADAMKETGAQGPAGMGLVMKALKDKTAGRVDGKILSEKVKAALAK
ncbi:GatB/YqeY domain-containing protein [bacterium]|nr:GatB/YqeY domain-containing protein [bacterium]